MIPEQEQILAQLATLARPTLERIARLFIEEVGYLDDHDPDGREVTDRFSCTLAGSYHRCSAMTPHADDCDGTCKTGKPCVTTQDVWCRSCGFDCPECELVIELRQILDSRAREPEAVTPDKERDQSGV